MVHKLKTIRGDMLVLQCQLERELIRIFGEEKVKIIDFSVYTKHNGEV